MRSIHDRMLEGRFDEKNYMYFVETFLKINIYFLVNYFKKLIGSLIAGYKDYSITTAPENIQN